MGLGDDRPVGTHPESGVGDEALVRGTGSAVRRAACITAVPTGLHSVRGGTLPARTTPEGATMPRNKRTELEQEVVDALIETKAIDFEAAGSVLAKYGAQAAQAGTGIAFVVGPKVIRDWCIPVDFEIPRQILTATEG